MINCKHWTDCGVKGGGCCAINRYGHKISYGVCGQCSEIKITAPKSHKPGDILKNFIEFATGEKPTSKCSCTDRALLMNLWGYKICWKNRQLILLWLVDEGRKRGYNIKRKDAISLFASLLKAKHDKGKLR